MVGMHFSGFVRVLAGAGQAHPDGRDGMDDPAHPVAARQRRGGQGVCQTQVGHSAGRAGRERALKM
jgi:hypothetical protein